MKPSKPAAKGESLCNKTGEDLWFWGVVETELSGDLLPLSKCGGMGPGGGGPGGPSPPRGG